MLFDLDKIGQLLKTTRVEKGLTLEDVSRALFIRKSTIAGIECGDWQNLPHVTYVKGYVTQYASLLQVLDLVKPELTPKESPDSLKEGRKERAVPRQGTPLHQRDLRKKIIGGAVMAGIMVAFLVFLNVQRPGDLARPPNQAPQHTQQAAVANRTAQPDGRQAARPQNEAVENDRQSVAGADRTAQSADPQASRPPNETAESDYETVAGTDRSENAYDRSAEKVVLDPKKLMIACQERTWVRVVIDGSEKKEFMLNREEVVVLSAKESFDLLIGNAAGVKLFYNGKDIDFTGESGEVKRVNLS